MVGLLQQNARGLLMGAVFFTIFFSVVSLHFLTTRPRQLVLDRLAQINKKPKHQDARQAELDAPFFQRVMHPGLSKLAVMTKKLLPAEKVASLQRKLVHAGNPGKLSAGEFAVIQLGMAVLLAAGAALVGNGFSLETKEAIFSGIAAGMTGYLLPAIYLNRRIAARKQLIKDELPDALDLLTISVDAGLGFDAALVKVMEKKAGTLAGEFSRMVQEIKKGKPRRDALRDLAERCQVNDLSSFVGALVQADQLGVGISNVLKIQAEQMRQRRRQAAEERAMKAPIKMLFPLIFFIFPTIFIVLLGPAVIQLLEVFGN